MLPEVVAAVRGSSCEVYVDGGFSQGTDIFKALALGARMVSSRGVGQRVLEFSDEEERESDARDERVNCFVIYFQHGMK